jgi:hypothetical protein
MLSALPQGWFYDKYGVWKSCVLNALTLFIGYLLIFFLTTHAPSATFLAIIFYFIGQGSHGYYTLG